ncbi:unnamed protein product [Schistosoma curassoni]|uniref:Plug domain-containing protein n=1 Tax=Schistosoma curassoni TaxID=6186 RepID=A0A183KF44_9TREM|nr:unnamed protein product [Schistosoma curassoni]
MLPDGFHPVSPSLKVRDVTTELSGMVIGGVRQETLDSHFVLLGTRQQCVPVILRELVLPGGRDPVSPSFIGRDVTTELSGP